MPYAGKDLTMVVLLPKKVDGLLELEKSLTAANMAKWLAKIAEREANVTLPKFRTTSEFDLAETLAKPGHAQRLRGRRTFPA